jgi:hypothetical protein
VVGLKDLKRVLHPDHLGLHRAVVAVSSGLVDAHNLALVVLLALLAANLT